MTTATAAPASTNGGPPAPTFPSLADAVKVANEARVWAKGQNVESDQLIDLLMLSAIGRRHGFIVGDGGSGKSKVVRDVFSCLPGQPPFITQFRRDMDTQAVFGPISLKGLENDDFRHMLTGFLADARWAFCDEFADASTLIMRSLLMVMNERQFPNGNQLVPVPLDALIGAGNFWRTEPEVAALMDRFAWRYVKEPVKAEVSFLQVLTGQLERNANGGAAKTPPPVIDDGALYVLQQTAASVEVDKATLKKVAKLRAAADKDGLIVSVRRYGEGLALAQARAAMLGRTKLNTEDLIVFADVLADEQEDISKAYELCQDFAGSSSREANELRKALMPYAQDYADVKAEIDGDSGKITTDRSAKLVKIMSDIRLVGENVDGKIAVARKDGQDTAELDALKVEVDALHTEARNLAMGGLA